MKKISALLMMVLLAATLLTGCSNTTATDTDNTPSDTAEKLSGVVKTGGSTSVEKVMTALIYQFQEDNKDVTINYELNGSGDGIKNTISGQYEIGHSSRELKTDGTEDGLDATAYAIDGIAIVINTGNDVQDLTQKQLKDIYTGAITNWKEVGGNDVAITVITREPGSGTRDAFAEIIGLEKGGSDIISSASVADNTGAIQTQVSSNPNAIGYMSYSDVDDSKVNTVKYEGVEISEATLKDGTYTLKREFFLLTKTGATLSPAAQAFVDFVMSKAGQDIVADNKLLRIK
ncbi:MAG: phosphate ABC transporter substrate-binding protein [Peptococcaceae bacterium]|nr:phosphate ABC transporter substrate-binding protein [Peptococcaceae bacterium]